MALTLTLATVVFAIVDGVLFRPLPYPDADRLFAIQAGFEGVDRPFAVSAVDLSHWSAAAPGVILSGFRAGRFVGFGTGVNDYNAGVAFVQSNIFDALSVRPLVGGFAASDFTERQPLVPAVITWDLWQSRFDADPSVVGREEVLDRARRTGFRVVGIMPRGFTFPSEDGEVQFLLPFQLPPAALTNTRSRPFPYVVARAPGGMSKDVLQARVEAGMRAAAAEFPDIDPPPEGWSEATLRIGRPLDRVDVRPLSSALGQRSRALFLAVFVAAAVLVGLGALNASGLMAARALDRQRELGVRRALGASRLALSRLVAIESALLLVTAAAVALVAAQPTLRLVLTLLPEDLVLLKPWAGDVFDWRVAAFVVIAAAALVVPTSIWPVRRAVTVAPGGGAAGGRATERQTAGGRLVIAGQVAGAFVLTVAGALLVGSLLSVYAQPLPIRTDGVMFIEAELQGPDAYDDEKRSGIVDVLLGRLREVTGVRAVALISGQTLVGPMADGFMDWGFARPRSASLTGRTHAVTADYFRILQPERAAGRLPTETEVADGAPVIAVSESLARSYWPGTTAIGQVLHSVRDRSPFTVVGVVRDVRWMSWDTETASIYGPFDPLSSGDTVTLFLDVAGDGNRVLRDVLGEIDAMAPPVAARRAGPLIDVFADTVRPHRFRSWLFGSFAAASLLVVGVGILGLLAMSTARRTREVGIRQALGATQASIVRLLVGEQLVPVVAGLVAGAVIAAWAVGFVESYLYQVTTADARIWSAAAGLIISTASLGALIPAARASAIDPTTALRSE
jgi:predicted permease